MKPANTPQGAIYADPAQPIAARVADLISRMTLEEKISQMVHEAPAIKRLGIPAYNWWNECLHGVGRAGIATVFPQAIGMAATWDVDLLHRVGLAISNEVRAKHHAALAQFQAVLRSHLLDAEYQHFPRSALGPGPGDLRRGSLSDLAVGRNLH